MAEPAEVEWRKLRADQLRESARADAVVILPVASLEQHGPHLPVEVDSVLGETVAVRAARKIAGRGQQAVVLPVLWTGLSEHHMSFGGTITLDFPAFSAVVEGVCRSVLRHGFKRIVLLNALHDRCALFVRRNRKSGGGHGGEGRAAVRGDCHRAGGQAVQCGAVGVAVASLGVIASSHRPAEAAPPWIKPAVTVMAGLVWGIDCQVRCRCREVLF